MQLLAAAPRSTTPILFYGRDGRGFCGMLGILGITLKISTIHTVLPRSSSLCPPLPPPPFGQIQHRKAVCFPQFRCCLQQDTPSDAAYPLRVYTVFPRFLNLVWKQNLSLPALADFIRASQEREIIRVDSTPGCALYLNCIRMPPRIFGDSRWNRKCFWTIGGHGGK